MRLIKCVSCQSSASIQEIINDNNEIVYKCFICGRVSPQAISLDSRLKMGLSSKGELQHYSVCVIVRNTKGQILLENRRLYPFTWSLVFGHVHNGESPKDTVIRELIEETALRVSAPKLLFTELLNSTCRTGVKQHQVSVFEVLVPDNTPAIANSESQQLVWVVPKNLKKYHPLGESSVFILKKLRLLQ